MRGHRFELEEIERTLVACPGVVEAVASAVEVETSTEIRAAVFTAPREGLADRIGNHCAQKLPRFVRPARLIFLEAFPRLVSGKIDRLVVYRLLA